MRQCARWPFTYVFAGILIATGAYGASAKGPELQVGAEPAPREFPADPPAPLSLLEKRLTEPASVWIRGRFTSVQVNVDQFGDNIVGDAANEPSIAIDPTDPDIVVIGWRQFDSVQSNFREAGWAYSHDSGQTWTFPGVLQEGQFRSDPVLDTDADGNFYFYSLSSITPVELFKSTDGGVSWSGPVPGFGGDKEWMVIDKTTGIGRGNIYGIWNSQYSCCPPDDFTRSIDGGASFQWSISIPNPKMKWGTMDIGPDGQLYLCGATLDQTGHVVAKSTNARNRLQTPVFDFVSTVNLGGVTTYGGINPDGLLGQVWIAADRSNGPTGGNVYMLGSVNPPGTDPLDVMFIRSTDGGLTWSAPLRVNDDPVGNNAWQWFGTMSVAPNGRIDVVWNDTRNAPSSQTSELYYAYSYDAGLTWSANEPVSPSFNHSLGYPQQNKLGDYYHMISENGAARLAYAATMNGEEDIYYVRITPDCNGNGIADETDIADLISEDCNENLTPDECEPDADCNENLILDICDIAAGTSVDCNYNGVPDECDVAQGTSPDANGNGVPDECECPAPVAPQAAPGDVAKTRYISFVPGSPGQRTALRVALGDLPAPFEGLEGDMLWVGPPRAISELSGVDGDTPPTFTGASLQCEPYYRDWGSGGTVFVFDDEIVPWGRYDVQAIREGCWTTLETSYSPALEIHSGSRWGDVVGAWNGIAWSAPDGDADFDDIAALVDKFKNLPGAPSKTQADLAGDVPSLVIDFDDISRVVEGFKGLPYPFDGPGGCP